MNLVHDDPEARMSLESLRGRETILVVEDDPNLRLVVARMLERFGYTVLVAGNGQEALEVFDALGGGVDLVLTDVVMPDLGGPELVERLSGRGVAVPVIYMSGYSDPSGLRRVVMAPRSQLLRKPFALESLLRVVRSVLEA
jgi:CheY-like chemotaxis protein